MLYCKCFPPASPSSRHPSCAVPCCAVTYPAHGGHNLPCSQLCQGGKGELSPKPHSFLLHIEILQERAWEERSTCSVNPISIAAVPLRKHLVCSPWSLDKVRDVFLKEKWVIPCSWSQPALSAWWRGKTASHITEQDPPLVHSGVMSDSKAKQNKHVNLSHSCHWSFPVS